MAKTPPKAGGSMADYAFRHRITYRKHSTPTATEASEVLMASGCGDGRNGEKCGGAGIRGKHKHGEYEHEHHIFLSKVQRLMVDLESQHRFAAYDLLR
ncbi:radical SAM protein [Anopheles sinensis]|uniref:Radical SAM protein n=1 Tax=Anopheles sinensis TaxID=74873 RepID=A0A084VC34_ANOSI|nr:radical SAM protein [Anopheles sinensis]